ncbi:hypothetical protein ACEQ8H_003812 [Pleosporales sp. CAS-2024a]
MSSSAPLDTIEAPRRVRWAEPTHDDAPVQRASRATSKPIAIPGRNFGQDNTPESTFLAPRRPRSREYRTEEEERIHHRRDDVGDYCKLGNYGWECARQQRINASDEGEVGNIIAGEWPYRADWEIPPVVRKDVDFDASPTDGTGQDWEDEDVAVDAAKSRKDVKNTDLLDMYRKHVAVMAAVKAKKKKAATQGG